MAMVRCPAGQHNFDPTKHTSCPHCGVNSISLDPEKKADGGGRTVPLHEKKADEGKTVPLREEKTDGGGKTVPLKDGGSTVPLKRDQGADEPSGSPGATIAWDREKTGIIPVVGWLVNVEGSECGRDYRIRSGQNSIGRAQNMDICIQGDDTISEQQHAFLSYDPRGRQFRLRQGTESGLVYLNGEMVEASAALKAYDRVRLGETELVFIPFCGENFQWQDD